MEPFLEPDLNPFTFIIWSACSPRHMILLSSIWALFCLKCFINFSSSDSSVLICLVNYTFWLFSIFSSFSIAYLISTPFISCLSCNLDFSAVSLHFFFITQFLSISLPIWILSSLRLWSRLRISFSYFFWYQKGSEKLWTS